MAQRRNYLCWEDYFMGIAMLAAERSKDPYEQVGACIVNEGKRIVGIGYNGTPIRISDNLFPWQQRDLYGCHAEMNAIVMKTSIDVKDCTMYVTSFPCIECAKVIIQSGITKIKYLSKEKDMPLSAPAEVLKAAKVLYSNNTDNYILVEDPTKVIGYTAAVKTEAI